MVQTYICPLIRHRCLQVEHAVSQGYNNASIVLSVLTDLLIRHTRRAVGDERRLVRHAA